MGEISTTTDLTGSGGFRYGCGMEDSGKGLLQSLRVALEDDEDLAAVYLFGSNARGTATAMSDIDIALLLRPGVDASRYFPLRLQYIARIQEILRTEKVDVVILDQAPLHLAYEIVSRGVLLLDRDPHRRVSFEADRIGRFLDFKPFLAVQVQAIKRQLEEATYFD